MALEFVQQMSSPGQTLMVHFVSSPPPPSLSIQSVLQVILVQTTLCLVLFGNPWRAHDCCHARPQEVLLLLGHVQLGNSLTLGMTAQNWVPLLPSLTLSRCFSCLYESKIIEIN